jgi:hypothetical protein
MRDEVSKVYLDAVDELLFPIGFVRPRRSQEWSKRSDLDRIWVHLNFGKGLVLPSFGAEYLDLRRRWPKLPGAVYGTMRALGGCFKPQRVYSVLNGPQDLIADLREPGLREVTELQDRMKVLEALLSPEIPRWPVPSFSHRIRLAPLLLCSMNRIEAALALADDLGKQAVGKDQILPSYDVFLGSLRIATAS